MTGWIKAIGSLAAVIAAYVAISWMLAHRPDSRFVADLNAPKVATAQALQGQRKLLIVGGSNGLYGLRCAILTERVGLPCVNLTSGVPVGLDIILTRARRYIEPGDLVVLSFEYEFFVEDAQTILTKRLGNTYLLAYDRGLLAELGPKKTLAALFGMSFEDMIARAVEKTLVTAGILEPWRNRARITPEGDMADVTPEVGAIYLPSIARAHAFGPSPAMLTDPPPIGTVMIRDFLHELRRDDVTTVAILPTTFDDERLGPGYLDHLRSLYTACGGVFLDLPNEARHPRSMFYDMAYHLNEPGQILHTTQLADAILAALGSPPRSVPAAPDCP